MPTWLTELGLLLIITLPPPLTRLEQSQLPSIKTSLATSSRGKSILKIVLEVFKGIWKELTLSDTPSLKKNPNKNISYSFSRGNAFVSKIKGEMGEIW